MKFPLRPLPDGRGSARCYGAGPRGRPVRERSSEVDSCLVTGPTAAGGEETEHMAEPIDYFVRGSQDIWNPAEARRT
jgi:hypothetical protein